MAAAAKSTRSRAKADPKPAAKQSARSVMTISRTLYGAEQPDEVIEGPIHIFETTPAQAGISANVTKNLGNFESLKLGVNFVVPCYVEDLDQTADNVAAVVSGRLDMEVEQYMNGGDVGPEEGLDEQAAGEPEVEEGTDPEPEVEEGVEEGEELTELEETTEDGETLYGDAAGNYYTLDENGEAVLYAEAEATEEAGPLETTVEEDVDEHGNPYTYDEQGNRLENEYTDDGYLIQYDEQGAPYIINEVGDIEPIEYEGDAEQLPEEAADPEPEPAPPPKRAASRNPRSSRRGNARGAK